MQQNFANVWKLFSALFSVKKPDRLSYEEAVAGIGDCLKAYTAMYYQAHVCGGDTVLVIDGATSFGNVAIQLASLWGAKVSQYSYNLARASQM